MYCEHKNIYITIIYIYIGIYINGNHQRRGEGRNCLVNEKIREIEIKKRLE